MNRYIAFDEAVEQITSGKKVSDEDIQTFEMMFEGFLFQENNNVIARYLHLHVKTVKSFRKAIQPGEMPNIFNL